MTDKETISYYTYITNEKEKDVKPVYPQWNVIIEDKGKIKVYDVLGNYFLLEYLVHQYNFTKNNIKKHSGTEEEFKAKFLEILEGELMYRFWSKYEYETTITGWPAYIDAKEIKRIQNDIVVTDEDDEIGKQYNKEFVKYRTDINLEVEQKIDVYDQIMLNWFVFSDYVWNNIKGLKKHYTALKKKYEL